MDALLNLEGGIPLHRNIPLRGTSPQMVAFCFFVAFAAILIGVIESGAPVVLVSTGILLLAGTLLLVHRAASRQLGTSQTLCVLAFSLAVAHIVVGYILAGLTTEHTSIRSNAEVIFAKSMLINAIGLFAGAVGYLWKFEAAGLRRARANFFSINIPLAEKLFRLTLLVGSGLMFYVYRKLGYIDFFAEPSKWPYLRYVTGDLLGGSATDEWIVNRAMDCLTISLPFVLMRALKRRTFLNILLAAIGYFALLLPLRRANLLAVTLAFLILVAIERKSLYRFTRKALATIAVVYIVSQCIFLLEVFAGDIGPLQIAAVSSTALPEVRDLGWTISLLHGESLDGVTFAQTLIPLPSIASDWSTRHSLRSITTKLIGLDQTGETGGLRLTIMGEGFLNFGYLGALFAGFLWGVAVAWCEHLLLATGKHKPEFANYTAVLSFVAICFLVYLAGTQAAASIKVGAILVLGIGWISKNRDGMVRWQPRQQT